jgi:hypothetical protein
VEDSEWQRKGATLSDKTAREEYGLEQDDIIRAIRAGRLHYREGSVYGNPFLRLLRREVEDLVKDKRGGKYLTDRLTKTELARINRELKRLKSQIATLEERKSKLLAGPCSSLRCTVVEPGPSQSYSIHRPAPAAAPFGHPLLPVGSRAG